jgi:Tfp pilus assembly protein PilE
MIKKHRQKSAGFTLIELLIIAPIVVIAISGFIALMISLVGKVLLTRDQASMSYDTQNALNRIEEDVRLSAKFLTTSGTLPSPQGSDSSFNGTAAFTNTSNTLILNALATDSNPRDYARWLMYYDNQPNPCGSGETSNRAFSIKVIYFIKSGTLWRRTYVPDWNLNTSSPDANTICTFSSDYYPWQQNSCSPGYTASRCKGEDERIMDNVNSLTVQYYADSNSTTDLGASAAESAATIGVTINGGETTAGNAFTSSSSLRVTKLNTINTDASPLTAPVVSHSNPLPDQAQFSWPGIASATNYLVSYNINGGSWTNTTLGSSTTSYTVDAERGDTVSFKVAATNGANTSTYTTDADTLDLWTDLTLQNGWANYNNSYATAGFTRSPTGRVFLKGLVRYGTVTNGTVIANLPQGYRPAGKLVFQAATSANVSGRIDVAANGDVIIVSGSTNWIALDNISFLPSSSQYTWNELPFYNSWTNWNGGYETVHATKDSLGRVNIQGLAKAGTTTVNTTINQLSDINSTYYPPTALHFPAGGSGFSMFWVWNTSGQVVKRGAQTSSYMGLQALFYPGTTGTWSSPALQNSWVNYGGTTYPLIQYTKDSDKVVTVRGLVKNGTATTNTIITNLPLGYRPTGQIVITTPSNEDFGRVDVTTSGNIIVQSVDNVWLALNFSYIVN